MDPYDWFCVLGSHMFMQHLFMGKNLSNLYFNMVKYAQMIIENSSMENSGEKIL